MFQGVLPAKHQWQSDRQMDRQQESDPGQPSYAAGTKMFNIGFIKFIGNTSIIL